MITADLVGLLALAAFIVFWFAGRGVAFRSRMAVLLLLAFAAGLTGMLIGRWQAVGLVLVAGVLALVLGLKTLRTRPASRQDQPGRPWLTSILAVVLTAASFVPLYLVPVFSLPEPNGPHPVGVRDFDLTDDSRRGIMGAAAQEGRRLPVRVWYPAAPGSNGPSVPYFSPDEVAVTAPSSAAFARMPSFFFDHLGLVETHGQMNVAIAQRDGAYPVVLFSHGYTANLKQNTALMEHLASHGYLVFSLAHVGDAADVPFADGEIGQTDPAFLEYLADKGGFSEAEQDLLFGETLDIRRAGAEAYYDLTADRAIGLSAPVWLEDRLFVLRALRQGLVPAQVKEIAAAGDYGRVGHVGMSYGGSAAVASCRYDPGCKGAVNMDGLNQYGEELDSDHPHPVMMMHSDWPLMLEAFGVENGDESFAFNDFSYEANANAGQTETVYRFRVLGAKHAAYAELVMMTRSPLKDMFTGPVDGDEMLSVMNVFVGDFFDRHVRGQANGFPAPQLEQFDGRVLRHSAAPVRAWWDARQTEPN